MPERESREIPSWLKDAADNFEELAVDDGSPVSLRHHAENARLEQLVDEAAHRIAQLRLRNLQDSLSDVEGVLTGLRRELELRARESRSTRLTEQLVQEAEGERARLLQMISGAVRVPGILPPPPRAEHVFQQSAGEASHYLGAPGSPRHEDLLPTVSSHFLSFYERYSGSPGPAEEKASTSQTEHWDDYFYRVRPAEVDPDLAYDFDEEESYEPEPAAPARTSEETAKRVAASRELPPAPAPPRRTQPAKSFSLQSAPPRPSGAPSPVKKRETPFSLGPAKFKKETPPPPPKVRTVGFLDATRKPRTDSEKKRPTFSLGAPAPRNRSGRERTLEDIPAAASRPLASRRAAPREPELDLEDGLAELESLSLEEANLLELEELAEGAINLDVDTSEDLGDFDLDFEDDDLDLESELTLEDVELDDLDLEFDLDDLELDEALLDEEEAVVLDTALGADDLALDEELVEDDLDDLDLIDEVAPAVVEAPAAVAETAQSEPVAEVLPALAEVEQLDQPLEADENLDLESEYSLDDLDEMDLESLAQFEDLGDDELDLSQFDLGDLDAEIDFDSDELDEIPAATVPSPEIEQIIEDSFESILDEDELVSQAAITEVAPVLPEPADELDDLEVEAATQADVMEEAVVEPEVVTAVVEEEAVVEPEVVTAVVEEEAAVEPEVVTAVVEEEAAVEPEVVTAVVEEEAVVEPEVVTAVVEEEAVVEPEVVTAVVEEEAVVEPEVVTAVVEEEAALEPEVVTAVVEEEAVVEPEVVTAVVEEEAVVEPEVVTAVVEEEAALEPEVVTAVVEEEAAVEPEVVTAVVQEEAVVEPEVVTAVVEEEAAVEPEVVTAVVEEEAAVEPEVVTAVVEEEAAVEPEVVTAVVEEEAAVEPEVVTAVVEEEAVVEPEVVTAVVEEEAAVEPEVVTAVVEEEAALEPEVVTAIVEEEAAVEPEVVTAVVEEEAAVEPEVVTAVVEEEAVVEPEVVAAVVEEEAAVEPEVVTAVVEEEAVVEPEVVTAVVEEEAAVEPEVVAAVVEEEAVVEPEVVTAVAEEEAAVEPEVVNAVVEEEAAVEPEAVTAVVEEEAAVESEGTPIPVIAATTSEEQASADLFAGSDAAPDWLTSPIEEGGAADLFEQPPLVEAGPVSARTQDVSPAVTVPGEDIFAGGPVSLDDLLAPSKIPTAELLSPVGDDLFGSPDLSGPDIFGGAGGETPNWLLEGSPEAAAAEPVAAVAVAEAPPSPATPPPGGDASPKERRRLVRLTCDFEGTSFFEGRPIHGRIQDISLGGMKFNGPVGLVRGQLLQVANPLPDVRSGDPVRARIVWLRPPTGHTQDIGLQFEESPETLGRSWVITVLNKIGMQSKVFNQRKFTRAVANLAIEIELPTREVVLGMAVDIGLGGAFITTDRPFTPTTRFTVSMGPLGNNDKLKVKAEVIMSRHEEDKGNWGQSLKFIEMGPAQTKLLGRYVVDLLKTSGSV